MSSLRQDPTTHDWVVIAPSRANRPGHEHKGPQQVCPFCPGNESMTPGERWRKEDEDGSWLARVVDNRYPVLAPGPARHHRDNGLLEMDGTGHHEVVIESRDHAWDLSIGRPPAVRAVLEAYRARYEALRHLPDVASIVIFRNHGAASGTSLEHPHSQIVATPAVPAQIRRRTNVALHHYDDLGTCLGLEAAEQERKDGSRVILEGDRLLAYQPFASRVPHETWILPMQHQASFGETDDQVLDELAWILREVLGGLRYLLDDPPYNLVIHSTPMGLEARPFFVWHVQISPRLVTPAGFELGTGIPINPSTPEETAAALREAMTPS